MLAKSLEECKADKLVICPSQVISGWKVIAIILMCNCNLRWEKGGVNFGAGDCCGYEWV
jgi:hypothetical protein